MKPPIQTKKFTSEQIFQASQINLFQLKDDEDKLSFENRPSVFGITIDDATTVDRDDGIWLVELSNGNYELQVSITDVSALIPEDSPIDKEAFSRVTTLYHTKPITPMLPVHVSTNLGSLEERQARLAITVFFEINSSGKIEKFRIEETIFKSLKAFSYEEVETILSNPRDNIHDHILIKIQKLAQMLGKSRMGKSGILTVDGYVDEDGNLIKENINTYQLIAELMILTNTTIANVLNAQKIPALYRTQDVGIDDFSRAIKEMGHCLVPAIYSIFAQPHVGLSLEAYCHFTSPLRRFVDLVNHRIVKALIKNKKSSYSVDNLQDIANYINNFSNQYKQDKSNYLRLKRKKELKSKYISINDQQIRELSNDDFSNLVEYLAFDGNLDKIIHHLHERFNDLQLKDFYYLWFFGRLKIFFDYPDIDGISVLLIASQIMGIEVNYDVEYDSQKQLYYCFCCLDNLTNKVPAKDTKKTKAKHKSALMAIRAFIDQNLVNKNEVSFPFTKRKKPRSKIDVLPHDDLNNFEKLTDKNLSKSLDNLMESDALNDQILLQLEKVVDRLQPKDLYKLWFIAKVNRFFDYPDVDAVSVLLVRSQIDSVKVEYDISKNPDTSYFIASCYVDGLTAPQAEISSKKNKAKQQSALAYIKGFIENTLTDKPNEISINDDQNLTKKTKLDNDKSLVIKENKTEILTNQQIKEKDWISLLHQFCLQYQIDYPEYHYSKIDSFFCCKVKLLYCGKIIQSEGYGKNKKYAKQSASQLLIIHYDLNIKMN